MARKLSEQEQAVADYLESIGVTYTVLPKGPTKRDGWECDEWSPWFERGSEREGRRIEQPFFTGTGLREPSRPMPADIARLRPNILARVEWEKRYMKPVAPCAASVLYSLLLDSRAADMSFYDWCDDLGHDSDSRKAEALYDDCCKIGRDVRAFFTREERAELERLLEDY